MMERRRWSISGFTLIELLIVVAIIGIIAGILIPNMLDALHKGRQKKTMADIKVTGAAMAAYLTDFSGAAAAGQSTVQISDFAGTGDIDEIRMALLDYVSTVPEWDGWGYPFTYRLVLQKPPRTKAMLVVSGGRDGIIEDNYAPGVFETTDYDQDIVWADGGFVRAPKSASASAGS